MMARVFSVQTLPARLEQAVGMFRDNMVPGLQTHAGFRRALLLSEPTTGRALSITLWESETDLQASEADPRFLASLAQVAPLLAAPPASETWVLSVQA